MNKILLIMPLLNILIATNIVFLLYNFILLNRSKKILAQTYKINQTSVSRLSLNEYKGIFANLNDLQTFVTDAKARDYAFVNDKKVIYVWDASGTWNKLDLINDQDI